MKREKEYRNWLLVFALVGSTLFLSCKSVKNAATLQQEEQAFTNLSELVATGQFRIEIDVVQPFNTAATTAVLNQLTPNFNGNTAGRINVSGNGHYLEVTKDMAKGSMPYFGQQLQGGGNFGQRDVGVDLDGKMDDYTIEVDDKKRRVLIEFNSDDSNNKAENYNVIITAMGNNRADVMVVSSQRTGIRYLGSISPIAAE